MIGLCFISLRQYSSSLYEIARNLLRSRNTQARRAKNHAEQLKESKREKQQFIAQLQQKEKQLDQQAQLVRKYEQENQELRQQLCRLPDDLPLKNHKFGPKMIALCMNLNNRVGGRASEDVLKLVFEWLGVDTKIPSYSSIRCWACRLGVALLNEEFEAGDDMIWMADHSNQIGQDKVLKILGIRASQLPELGETLSREDLRVLAVVVGKTWKAEDVRREYEKLAERIGPPRFLVVDGAVELRDSADTLQKPGKKLTVLRDLKHVAANTFEKLMNRNDRFAKYLAQLGRTRSAVQQTELGHFTPPPQAPKARFMNLGPSLRWGQMVSYHLSNPRSQAREEITAGRMNDKLGWVRNFRSDLACWSRCQHVLQASLGFINRQGVYRGAAAKLKAELAALDCAADHCQTSQSMTTQLVDFVKTAEEQLDTGERAWLSTENLESSFGAYKRLEGQHSKGGFTSLVAAMPTLITHWTADRVRELLPTVSVAEMRQWVRNELGQTMASKRNLAYSEYRKTLRLAVNTE